MLEKEMMGISSSQEVSRTYSLRKQRVSNTEAPPIKIKPDRILKYLRMRSKKAYPEAGIEVCPLVAQADLT